MSSLKATQADGYYIPPSSILNSGGKTVKANNNQYLKRGVVRFELPYDGFCEACQCYVGRGTRFNAYKKHVDDYYTTKIWEFTMTCRLCASKDNIFTIRTNPKDQSFDYVSGIRAKKQPTNSVATTVSTESTVSGHGNDSLISKSAHEDECNKLDNLEKQVLGERKVMTERDALENILQKNKATKYLDANMNSNLRSTYRKERQAKKRRLKEAMKLGLGGGIELLPIDSTSKPQQSFPQIEQNRRRHLACKEREKQAFSNLNSIFQSSSTRKGSKPIILENQNQKNRNVPNTVKNSSTNGKKISHNSSCGNTISISSKNQKIESQFRSRQSLLGEKKKSLESSKLSSILVDYSSDDD